MLSEQSNITGQPGGPGAAAVVAYALGVARQRMRWFALWPSLARGAVAGLILAAAWIALTRFTLIELPAWPAVALYSICIVGPVIFSARRTPTASRAARYLDAQLALDERVSTYLELRRSGRLYRRGAVPAALIDPVLNDAASLVAERIHRLPARTRWRASRRDLGLLLLGLVLLAASAAIPTPLETVRTEQAALRRALATRIADLQALRVQIQSDTSMSEDVKQKLYDQLLALEQKLATPGLNRSDLVAALAAAEDKVRELSVKPPSTFDSLLEVSELIWNQAVNTQYWPADAAQPETAFLRGAAGADFLSDVSGRLNTDEVQRVAGTLDRAALQSADTHPKFTLDFNEAAQALRLDNRTAAARKLEQVARRFREAIGELRTAQTVEETLARLDESRNEVAQAGKVVQKRGQVGFSRRGKARNSTTPSASPAEDVAVSLATPRAERGMPPAGGSASSGAAPGGQPGKVATPGSTGPEGMPGGPPPGGSQSSTGSSPKSGSNGRQGGDGQGASAPGGGGAGDEKGTLQGAVTGPVGGSSGAISLVPNPQGVGSGGASVAQGNSSEVQSDKITVPEPGPKGGATSIATTPAKEGAGKGRVGGQTTGDPGGGEALGTGALTGLKTPYKDVIRQYAEQAAGALERTYIPFDAKEYVKQYFTVLGK